MNPSPIDRKNELLRRLSAKEIDMIGFMQECYMWSLEPDCMVCYQVRQYPTPPPQWQEYEAMPMDRRYKISEAFFHQPEVKKYLYSKGHVYAENYADWCWLNEVKKNVGENIELENRITDYRLWLRNSTPELESVATMFEGTVENERL